MLNALLSATSLQAFQRQIAFLFLKGHFALDLFMG
jgi:hypothetical protein